MNIPARQSTVSDLIEEYEEKHAAIDAAVAEFHDAFTRLEMASCIQGKFVGNVTRHRPFVYPEELRKNLRKSGWKAVYDRLQIDMIASAKDRKLFERTLEDPPELTFETAKATFGDYFMRPRFHILRGLAETFADLDPAFKSHSKVKIGVKGLPKRVIINNVGSWGSYGRDKLRDMVNALAVFNGQALMDPTEFTDLDKLHSFMGHTAGEVKIRGLTVRKFQNGNAHVFFDAGMLLDINRALAEFYGDVLPDAEEEGIAPRQSTAVSKDLQFYPTPKAVIDDILDAAGIYKPRDYSRGDAPAYRVLEPSCGDGRILDEIKARGSRGFGIEVHAARAAEARAKGHSVLTANFLEYPAVPDYDLVVMNPPFYGRHYVKHVAHALEFLKPGGTLVTDLPASAWYDHKELAGEWRDLPIASFAESGTNIPTGYLRIRKKQVTA
jgi:SAM-dependent methyltransferase